MRQKSKKLVFNFPVQGMAAKKFIVLALLNLVRLEFFIARRHVARRRLSFGTSLGAFDYDVLPDHAPLGQLGAAASSNFAAET
jgi:hypothetical protein